MIIYLSQYVVRLKNESLCKSSEGINEGIVVIKYRDSQNIETKIQKDLEDI